MGVNHPLFFKFNFIYLTTDKMIKMKPLFTDIELKEIIHDIDIAYIDMMDSEVHRQEVNWFVHDLEIFASVLCIRETLSEPYETYDHQEPGTYRYFFEIDDCCAYFNDEDCITNHQLENIIVPVLEVKIHPHG